MADSWNAKFGKEFEIESNVMRSTYIIPLPIHWIRGSENNMYLKTSSIVKKHGTL